MTRLFFILLVTLHCVMACAGHTATVESKFPRLSSGPLRNATVSVLKGDAVLVGEGITITKKDISDEIAKYPDDIRKQLTEYTFFLLEQMVTQKLILKEAKEWAGKNGVNATSDDDTVKQYLDAIVSKVQVTDAEVRQFYKENSKMLGGASFEKVKDQLKTHLERQKQEQARNMYLKSISIRHSLQVSQVWAGQQFLRFIKNPVERARRSGKPTLANFGADRCKFCDMMIPIRKDIEKMYKGKLNVLYVHLNNDAVLGAHYGISGVPVQVFYNKSGEEVYRHVGYWPKEEIIKKLADMGVK